MPDWNELFKDSEGVLDTPDPLAVELSQTLPPRAPVLDLGCGAGRHLVPLIQAGHRVIGFDVAPRGLSLSKNRLKHEGLVGGLVLGDFRRPLPFPDRAFLGVLSVKVLNHATADEVRVAFSEATRITRPGGRFSGTVISTLDARCGDGAPLGEDTYVHSQPPEAGVIHHYFSEKELRQLLSGFSTVDLHLTERVVSPQEPLFGQYRFREGVEPIFRHWSFRALL